jgi:hypothetical protein
LKQWAVKYPGEIHIRRWCSGQLVGSVMTPLWREPVRLDNRKLLAFIGAEPRTPLDEAVAKTLSGLGALG